MTQPRTQQNGQIIPRGKPSSELTLAGLIERKKQDLAMALPKHVSADRMLRTVTTALRTTPKLADCTPLSFLGAVMSCASLGLEPNNPLQHAWLIPRWSGKRKVALLKRTAAPPALGS